MRIIRKRSAKRLLACALGLCLAAGLTAYGPVYAASDFTTSAPFNGTGRSTYTHKGKYSGNLIVNGVDVSVWQSQKSNWKTAKKNGVDYAIMRVTWTGYRKDIHSYKNNDSNFETYYKNAKAAGVMVGCYVFSQATTVKEAQNEADFAIKRLKKLGITPKDLELPVYMDYEFAGGSSGRLTGIKKSRATKCAVAFCKRIHEAGYKTGVYANTVFFNNTLDASQLPSYADLWCAQYYSRCNSGVNYSKWQYSSSARIGGVLYKNGNTGSTDVNFWYLNKKSKMKNVTDVYGVTELNYTGGAIEPELEIYAGSKLLKEGTDYIIGGISNVKKGTKTAYAYVQGFGDYEGYIIIPFTIGSGYISRPGLKKCYDDNGNLFIGNASEFDGVSAPVLSSMAEDTDAEEEAAEEQTDEAADEEENAEDTSAPEETAETPAEESQEPMTDAELEKLAETAAPEENAPETVEEILAEEDEIYTDEEAEAVAEEDPEAVSGETAENTEDEELVEDMDVSEDSSDAQGAASDALLIGKNSCGSYLRNVPENITVSKLLSSLGIKKSYRDHYSLAVIDAKGAKKSGSTKVRTGMMLGVYKDSKLIGTANIAVNGDLLYGTGETFVNNNSVTVKKTSIKKLKAVKNGFSITVKKRSSVKGYQLKYSTNSGMSGAKKVKFSTDPSVVSTKITGLKGGKKYYVQVRCYKKENGKKYYSKWSTKKSVTTKKG